LSASAGQVCGRRWFKYRINLDPGAAQLACSVQLAAAYRSRVRVLAVEARCAEAGLGLGIVMDQDRDGAVS
jgi:hypothetical protein